MVNKVTFVDFRGAIAHPGSAPACIEYFDAIFGMRLDQRSYWDSWKFVGRPWRYQHGIWI